MLHALGTAGAREIAHHIGKQGQTPSRVLRLEQAELPAHEFAQKIIDARLARGERVRRTLALGFLHVADRHGQFQGHAFGQAVARQRAGQAVFGTADRIRAWQHHAVVQHERRESGDLVQARLADAGEQELRLHVARITFTIAPEFGAAGRLQALIQPQ